MRAQRQNSRAFSLIELLVVIGAVGIVLSLILSALGGSRTAAQQAKSSSNLRTIGQIVIQYTGMSKDQYPCAVAGRTYGMGCGIQGGISHWQAELQWPYLLEELLPWDENLQVFLSPRAMRNQPPGVTSCSFPPSYYYSTSFLADPRTWDGTSGPSVSFLLGRSVHQVLFAANKVLIWEWEVPYAVGERKAIGWDLAQQAPALFADGHVVLKIPSEASIPVPNPFPEAPGRFRRLSNTRGGVRGTDY